MNETIIVAVLTALAGIGGAAVKGFWDAWKSGREHELERKRIETDRSGEWSRALLVDQEAFRRDLMSVVGSLRDEIAQHDQRCDDKIKTAIEASEQECDDKIRRKLRSQAAQLRAEFRSSLEEATDGD